MSNGFYTAEIYRGLDRKYLAIGSSLGLIFGCSQETLRQLKQQRDEEEANQKQSSQLILNVKFYNVKILLSCIDI
ncbi:hypothetical protein STA3757_16960 [Stanieria sp. NIES-3757]|nr:hypothetical protein STA3757_16960 [Stanieria sp. NIES-3757]